MITKIYIKVVIALMTCFLNVPFDAINSKSNNTDLSEQLTKDYQEIFEYSERIKRYGITQEKFESFFRKGVTESFNFHQTSYPIEQSYLNRMIKKKLMNQSGTKHPLKKPSKISSKSSKGLAVLNSFSGEWFGIWKSMSVQHLWLPFRKRYLKIDDSYEVIGFQTCFTGDGFGWNYLVQIKGERFILGYVYHFNENGKLISENPHYAFLNDQSQLSWVSDNYIYYEFVCDDTNCAREKHYVINAIPYTTPKERPKFGLAYQTVYMSRRTFKKL